MASAKNISLARKWVEEHVEIDGHVVSDDTQLNVFCPLHDDGKRSGSISLESRNFTCHTKCGSMTLTKLAERKGWPRPPYESEQGVRTVTVGKPRNTNENISQEGNQNPQG